MAALRSLRDLLLNTPEPQSGPTHRLTIIKQLTTAVAYVHIFGIVHQNIRTGSVLSLFSLNDSQQQIYLAGIETFRRDQGWTQTIGDDVLDRNIYRHHSRQGLSPESNYTMQHDIYSLGVCLLEIRVWQSLVGYTMVVLELRMISRLNLALDLDEGNKLLSFSLQAAIGEEILELAREELPRCMGSKYADIVKTCLTCLEPANGDFGSENEFHNEQGISVGVRYIDKVSIAYQSLPKCCAN